MNSLTILTPNLTTFVLDIQEAFLSGYRIDPNNPATMFGNQYECIMVAPSEMTFAPENKKSPGRPTKALTK